MIKKSVVRNMLPADLSLSGVFKQLRDAGFHGVQLLLGDEKGDVRLGMSDGELRALKGEADEAGIELHSFMPSGLAKLIDFDPAGRKRAVEHFERGLEIAGKMGVPTLLVHPGAVSEKAPYDLAYSWLSHAFSQLAPVAEQHHCALAVENVWNKFLLSPLEARDFVDSFNTPAVRFYFDVGNIILYGFAEQWVRILGERIAEVHFKDFRRAAGTGAGFVPLLAGDVNWPAVMKELHAINYQGYVSAELGVYAHSVEQTIRDASSAMDAILKM